jgi:hypothetical protein
VPAQFIQDHPNFKFCCDRCLNIPEDDILPEIDDILQPLCEPLCDGKASRLTRQELKVQRLKNEKDRHDKDRQDTIDLLKSDRVSLGLVNIQKRFDKFTCKLYDTINTILCEPLPYDSNIIFWSENMDNKDYLGVTIGSTDHNFVDSIVLNTCLINDKQTVFDTLVHEIIHALNFTHHDDPWSACHGPAFKKRGRWVISQLKCEIRRLRLLCGSNLMVDGHNILAAKKKCQ